MRKKFTYFIMTGLLCSAVVSCSPNEIDNPDVSYQLNLFAQVARSSDCVTKADLLDHSSDISGKTLTVSGWEGSTSLFSSTSVAYSSGSWPVIGQTVKSTSSYSFLAYANVPSGADVTLPAAADGNVSISVTDITSAQEDILIGRGSASTPSSGDVNVNFSHPFSSVKFVLGNAVEVSTGITDIDLEGVYATGTTTFSQASTTDANDKVTYSWTPGSTFATLSESGLSVKAEAGEVATFVVIPQDLSTANATVTVTYDSGNTMRKVLSDGSWVAGYTTTYTLDKIKTIAFEFSNPSTNPSRVTNSGDSKIYIRATITGAWYDGSGNIVGAWYPTESYGTFTGLPGTDWVKSGEMYYYTKGIASGNSASDLYTSYSPTAAAPVAGAVLKIDILVQAIPYHVSKSCQEAFAAL